MTRRTTRWMVGLAAIPAAGFVLLNVLAYNQARAMTHFSDGGEKTRKPERLSFPAKIKVLFRGVNLPRPYTQRPPTDVAADCRDLAIPGPEGKPLAAWYCNRGDTTPLVILLHGYGAEKSDLIEEAKVFVDLGASVLLADFRGSGGSPGSCTTIGVREADDVVAVAAHAREHLRHSPVILFGRSMGAAAVLRAVHAKGLRPDGVILDAVFDTLLATVRNRFRSMRVPPFPSAELLVFWGGVQFGFNGFAHNPVTYARSLHYPVLFLHNTHDPRATLAEGRRVFQAVPGPKEFREFPSSGHDAAVTTHPAAWRAAVEAFLNSLSVTAAHAQ